MLQDPAHRCSILVVEDEPDLQELLRVALEQDRYTVTVVDNGRAALAHLRSTPHTCAIVLDLVLPVMSGREFRALQLRDRSHAWVPLIVVSGAIEAAREARELGARGFVGKPVDVDRLRLLLRRLGCPIVQPHSEQRKTSPRLEAHR
ncbi:MAG: response regulator [Vicinamibacterales bacterium]